MKLWYFTQWQVLLSSLDRNVISYIIALLYKLLFVQDKINSKHIKGTLIQT